ncbi:MULTISPECIES: A24 family peptidase [Methylosinus]|uniref:Peptidase n=1 Tax=Methylosinus trichosporium (strain ATCC 35070 / NCIMB 11131 / UNIQEM 75 / OB3b) TaxID=595536 RepID=A0A2D2D648_METT3|nr:MULTISPECIES: prepilin peptidase [Methylosinus]ATQ70452.1 peptidase [Methylosinus trichosporium OB3b]OBS53005.1 peptidase [Methylosinus sp. 3S-1]
MIEAVALVLFPTLMVFAAFTDLLTMTIPNRVSIALVVIFAALAAYTQMPLAIALSHASCGMVMLIVTFAMFQLGWIGGGDAKLASATALWLGWDHLLDYGLAASLIGGALTLVILELRRREPRAVADSPRFAHLCDSMAGVPYGIALAIGGLLIYPQSRVWTLLVGA